MEKDIDEISELFSSVPQSPQISAVYNDLEELTELLALYFKQGIKKGEYCSWFSPNELATEKIEDELKKSGVDAENCRSITQLELQPAKKLPKNVNLLASAIKELAEKGYEKALSGDFQDSEQIRI